MRDKLAEEGGQLRGINSEKNSNFIYAGYCCVSIGELKTRSGEHGYDPLERHNGI
jgi:hypothetical protein